MSTPRRSRVPKASKPARPCAKCGERPALRNGKYGWHPCAPCRAIHHSANTPEARRRLLLSKYGLTPEMYEALAAAQQGRCAGCGGQPVKQSLNVDHAHALDKVYGKGDARSIRGLLCGICNRYILGYARDRAWVLRQLADYLDNPPAPKVLAAFLAASNAPNN